MPHDTAPFSLTYELLTGRIVCSCGHRRRERDPDVAETWMAEHTSAHVAVEQLHTQVAAAEAAALAAHHAGRCSEQPWSCSYCESEAS